MHSQDEIAAQKPDKWHSIDRVSCEIVSERRAWAYLTAARLTLLILEGKEGGVLTGPPLVLTFPIPLWCKNITNGTQSIKCLVR